MFLLTQYHHSIHIQEFFFLKNTNTHALSSLKPAPMTYQYLFLTYKVLWNWLTVCIWNLCPHHRSYANIHSSWFAKLAFPFSYLQGSHHPLSVIPSLGHSIKASEHCPASCMVIYTIFLLWNFLLFLSYYLCFKEKEELLVDFIPCVMREDRCFTTNSLLNPRKYFSYQHPPHLKNRGRRSQRDEHTQGHMAKSWQTSIST